MTLTTTEIEFEDVGIVIGGVFLLKDGDAIRFIIRCRQQGIAIAGIEGCRMIGEKIQPLQEHSIDFEEDATQSQEKSEAFVNDRLTEDLWFEVVSVEREARYQIVSDRTPISGSGT